MVHQKSKHLELNHIFIIGSKRSGTTWAMWLLAQHPSIVAFFHSDLYRHLQNLEKWWQTNLPYAKGIITANNKEEGEKGTKNNGYTQLHVNDFLSINEMHSYCRSFAANIIDKIVSSKPGAQVFLENTPENLECIEFILKVFPEAYILHIIRDPRSVFSSWRSAASTWSDPYAFNTNPIEFARRWHLDVTSARQAREMTNRYKEIHYEKLLNDGISHLGEIYSWLGLPTDEHLCRKAVEACKIDKLQKNVSMPKLQGFFRKGVAQGWHEEISSSCVRIIEYLAGDLMEELGYKRKFVRSTRKPIRIRIYEAIARALKWVKSGSVGKQLLKLRMMIWRMMK